MFKFLSTQLHKSKKGFTMIEMLIVMVLLALVTGMIAQIVSFMYKDYLRVEHRWKMQNEVMFIMQLFEGNREALSTSTNVDIFYDLECKSVVQSDTYSYFYAKPIDPADLSKGYDFYYLERRNDPATPSTPKKLNIHDIPIQVEFFIPLMPVPLKVENGTVTRGGKGETGTNEQGYVTIPLEEVTIDAEGSTIHKKNVDVLYQTSTIGITLKTTQQYGGTYALTTSFAMHNMLENHQVNFENHLPTTPPAGATLAGWTTPEANDAHYPITFTGTAPAYNEARPGNVVRYVSAQSFLENQKVALSDVTMLNKCGFIQAMMHSPVEVPVAGALRDFRDNVLSKTELGNKIINTYYEDVSPMIKASLEKHPKATKALCHIVGVPIAVVAYFVAN